MCYLKTIFISIALITLSACSGSSSVPATSTQPSTPSTTPAAFANLSTVGVIEIGRDFRAAQVSGNSIYYTDSFYGLSSVDISNPLRLTNKSSLIDPFHKLDNLSGYDNLYALTLAGNIAVVQVDAACLGMCVGDSRNIQLYDMSVGDKPKYLSGLEIPADFATVDNKILYLSSSNTLTSDSNLYIVDISTPSSPKILSEIQIQGCGPVAKKGDTLFLSAISYAEVNPDKFNDIVAVDVSDPTKPLIKKEVSSTVGTEYSPIIVNGDILYYLDYLGLNIVNISDIQDFQYVGVVPIAGYWPKSFTIHNNHLFVAAGNSGLLVYDITQPDQPVLIKSLKSNTDVLSVSVTDGVGFFVSDTSKVQSPFGYSIVSGNTVNLFYDK